MSHLDFFKDKDQEFVSSIVPLLMPLKLDEHENLYQQDEIPYEIFFIIKGSVDYYDKEQGLILKQWDKD